MTPPKAIFLTGPRACGKTTTGMEIKKRMPHWTFIDLDVEYRRRYLGMDKSSVGDQAPDYYKCCKEILKDSLAKEYVIVSLGGGTLSNAKMSWQDYMDMQLEMRRHGKLVLLLPSRWDFMNRKVLVKRELERKYGATEGVVVRHFEERIGDMRDAADDIFIGRDAKQVAEKIIAHYGIT